MASGHRYGFDLSALLLAVIGIYGVMSFAVASQTREIGIRMALGARYADVQRAVLGRAIRVTTVGIAAGIAGALALTRLMAGLLYEIAPNDPLTFIVTGALFAVVALGASYVPARRAASVDPVLALKG